MFRKIASALVLACLAAAHSAHAVRLEGQVQIIPVIGRFPGAGGTLWRTDVFLINPYIDTATVTLKFYATDGLRQTTVVMTAFQTLVFRDIVLNTFGAEGAGGPLEIEAGPLSRIEARARIYNAGSAAGQFSQGVEGISKDRLSRQATMYGLSGTSGYRLNVGATNPHDVSVLTTMSIFTKDNTLLWQEQFTLAPHTYRQFNDIVGLYGFTPQDGFRVGFDGEIPIYGFASEVRNDTGDAIFVFGTAPNTGP